MRFVRLILAVAVGALAVATDRASAAPEIGEAAPPLVLTAIDGTSIDLAKLRGKVVLVNFWATWCAPCRKEIPDLIKTQKTYVANGVQVVGIALDNVIKVREYAEEMRIDYALLIGVAETLGLAKDLGNRAGVLPFTVVLDRTGKLVHAHAGATTAATLNAILAPLL